MKPLATMKHHESDIFLDRCAEIIITTSFPHGADNFNLANIFIGLAFTKCPHKHFSKNREEHYYVNL